MDDFAGCSRRGFPLAQIIACFGLEAHELIKVSVLCETGSQAAEAGREIADQAEAELVQVIGKRVVLYRETTRDDIEKIQLVK